MCVCVSSELTSVDGSVREAPPNNQEEEADSDHIRAEYLSQEEHVWSPW